MPYPTPIEWTDATWNPVGGCSIASPGCGPCYAQKLAGTRLKNHPLYAGTTSPAPKDGRPIFNGTMTAAPDDADVWTWPLRWRGVPEGELRVLGPGMPSTIFVGDMSDVFHENRKLEAIDRIMATIARAPQHIFQLLTKRPDVMVAYCASIMPCLKILGGDRTEEFAKAWFAISERTGKKQSGFVQVPPDNIWFGTSAERQPEFDARWPHLRRLAEMGFVVFISYEPAMGPLVLPADFLALGRRAQVIAGGCSGDRAWPAHPDWFRRVRDQCVAAGVAFFFKQWGEYAPFRVPGRRTPMVRVGKKAAGRLLEDNRGIAQIMRRCAVCGLVRHSFVDIDNNRARAEWTHFGVRIVGATIPSCWEEIASVPAVAPPPYLPPKPGPSPEYRRQRDLLRELSAALHAQALP